MIHLILIPIVSIVLLDGCAHDSSRIPDYTPQNEQALELYLRGSHLLPKGEKVLYATNSGRLPSSCFSRDFEFGRLFITDKATHYIVKVGDRLVDTWKHEDSSVKAVPVYGGGLWICVAISNDSAKSVTYFGGGRKASRLINNLVEKAKGD